jgi:hypothetical protein
MPGMHQEPPGPVDDPFFGEVRRRHPDVDIVLLPPVGGPDADEAPIADDDAVATARLRVAAAARQLWEAAAPGSDDEPEERLGYAAQEGWVRSSARTAEPRDDGPDALDRLERELRGRGAEVRREPGSLPRVLADLDGLTVTGSAAATGAVLLAVESEPLHVGEHRAAALVRGAR